MYKTGINELHEARVGHPSLRLIYLSAPNLRSSTPALRKRVWRKCWVGPSSNFPNQIRYVQFAKQNPYTFQWHWNPRGTEDQNAMGEVMHCTRL